MSLLCRRSLLLVLLLGGPACEGCEEPTSQRDAGLDAGSDESLDAGLDAGSDESLCAALDAVSDCRCDHFPERDAGFPESCTCLCVGG